MAEDFHDFELTLSFDGVSLPEWSFREQPYKCRAFRSAIEAAGGDIPEQESLADAFGPCERKISAAAQAKIEAQLGLVDEPVPVVAADILP